LAGPISRGGDLASFLSRGGVAILGRIGLGLAGAALIVLIGGPIRRFAQWRGSTLGQSFPPLVHQALLLALGIRLRVHGAAAEQRPQLVVANHVSWLDIVVLGAMRPTEFLAKKEIGGGIFARELVALQGAAYVDRGRKRQIPMVNLEIARRMRAGAAMILFAEATTSDGNRLLPFRSSHFEAARAATGQDDQAIIQPIFLAYSRRGGLPVSRADRPLVAWYGDMKFFSHLWRFLRAGRFDCDIYLGAPIPVEGRHNRKMLARRAEGAVRELAERARLGATLP
jgi:lyso-ornithine lipid O-acyltransferase